MKKLCIEEVNNNSLKSLKISSTTKIISSKNRKFRANKSNTKINNSMTKPKFKPKNTTKHLMKCNSLYNTLTINKINRI